MRSPYGRLSVSAANLDTRFRITILALLTVPCATWLRGWVGFDRKSPSNGLATLARVRGFGRHSLARAAENRPILLPTGLAGFVLYDLQAGVSIPRIAWLILADTFEVLVAAWGSAIPERPAPFEQLKALAKYSFFTVSLHRSSWRPSVSVA